MQQRPVKIFTFSNVPRLKYIADLVLGSILGVPWELVTDKRKIGNCPVINYSKENIAGSFKINPSSILFETGVRAQEINISDWHGLPLFFQTSGDSDFPFDIFAASFYMVSRYEEYLEFHPDELGRFRASDSIAYKHGFLGLPIVDLWARELAKALIQRHRSLTFKHNEYKSLLTIDIDEPFAYLGRSLICNIGGLLHDFASRSGHPAVRIGCLTKGEKDPYEVLDYISDTIDRNCSDAKFFFLVGNHSRYEKNPSWKNEDYRNLISNLAARYSVGIQVSSRSSADISMINTERNRLNSIIQNDVVCNRFHLLKINLPESFRNLSDAGITEDYSMGYDDETGFRAGIARPFRFYDLEKEQITNLLMVPFQVMDLTLAMKKYPDTGEAKEVVINLIYETRRVGGLFVSIWHNTMLLDNPAYKSWRELFEFTLKFQNS